MRGDSGNSRQHSMEQICVFFWLLLLHYETPRSGCDSNFTSMHTHGWVGAFRADPAKPCAAITSSAQLRVAARNRLPDLGGKFVREKDGGKERGRPYDGQWSEGHPSLCQAHFEIVPGTRSFYSIFFSHLYGREATPRKNCAGSCQALGGKLS